MNIRFYNVRVLTMEEPLKVTRGEVWVKKERILHVGAADAFSGEKPKWDREIDGDGNLIMPGFKNAHAHSAMTFLRSYADDLPLKEWLNRQVFPMEAKLTDERVYFLTKLAILEYLTSGVTAAFDMYPHARAVLRAAEDSGFRMTMCGALNNFSQSLLELEECFLAYQGHELLDFRLGFHAEYTTSRELMEGLAALAHKYHAPVYTHNSETIAETRACEKRYGRTPMGLMEELGLFDYGGAIFHGVYLNDEDMDICRGRRVSVVTNPASNLKLASGVAPLCKMEERGINLAIGTDGPASNNCLDMFREMFLATALQKLVCKDAAAMDAGKVLRMATVGGAVAMGIDKTFAASKEASLNVGGSMFLLPGQRADLIMLDLHMPNMQPENHLIKNLVYSGSKQNVKLTMINGKIRYEDGQFFTGDDVEEIYRKANEIINEMKRES